MDSPTMITNSFKIPVIKTWKHFHHFLFFFALKFYSLFRNISKIQNDKKRETKALFFHANSLHQNDVYIFQESALKNENIHGQKQKDCP